MCLAQVFVGPWECMFLQWLISLTCPPGALSGLHTCCRRPRQPFWPLTGEAQLFPIVPNDVLELALIKDPPERRQSPCFIYNIWNSSNYKHTRFHNEWVWLKNCSIKAEQDRNTLLDWFQMYEDFMILTTSAVLTTQTSTRLLMGNWLTSSRARHAFLLLLLRHEILLSSAVQVHF